VILEIQKKLKDNIDKVYKYFLEKLIPTSKKIYGVRMPVINEIVKEFKNEGIPLVETLWKNASHEERLIAAKILGKHANKNPDKTFQLVFDYSQDLYDWAICDTLATQSLKPLVEKYKKEIWEISDELITSKNEWQRRYALVMIEYYTRYPEDHSRIKKQIAKVKDDNEFYVKKAVKWLERNMKKA
jgi:3-methyladenine DNA glycosylase AlkD